MSQTIVQETKLVYQFDDNCYPPTLKGWIYDENWKPVKVVGQWSYETYVNDKSSLSALNNENGAVKEYLQYCSDIDSIPF